MIIIHGKGVSRGVAQGPIHFLKRQGVKPKKRPAENIGYELTRLTEAQRQAAGELRLLADQYRTEQGEEAADLIETHTLLAEDEDFTLRIRSIIDEEKCCAEYAVQKAGEEFVSQFAAMEDSYMRARSADVMDVAQRIIRLLTGSKEELSPPSHPVILAADDLAPSETLKLDRKNILGFVTRMGSVSSHTAILARSMGLPAVCSAGEQVNEALHGQTACLDGETGELFIDPDERTLADFSERQDRFIQTQSSLASLRDEEDLTPAGQRIDLYANIGSTDDLSLAAECGARGIGLFRSEFLFLNASAWPSEEEQFEAYRAAAAAMGDRRTVIRTLDIGADKQADYLHLPEEENPALGVRGIRLCLQREDIFRTQLRALYRASAYGKIAIMFPMISSEWEVMRCLSLCRAVMDELQRESIPFRPETEIGVMIETPAAALIADRLAQLTDFFSVGTNDLIQYTLACDRQNEKLGPHVDVRHPAVQRLIRMAADAAHQSGIWIGICGELAADTSLLSEFLSMGIDELSVSPSSLLPLRAAIRSFRPGP